MQCAGFESFAMMNLVKEVNEIYGLHLREVLNSDKNKGNNRAIMPILCVSDVFPPK